MFLIRNTFGRALSAGLLVWLCVVAPAAAGWFGIQNDTKQTIVVQETFGPGRLGKPMKLPNEDKLRDTQGPAAGTRTFTFYYADKPTVPIYTGSFPCPGPNENYLFVIKADKDGKIHIEQQKSLAIPPKTGNGVTIPPAKGSTPPKKP